MSSFIQQILIPSRKAGSAQHLRVRPLFLKISCASGTGRKPVQQVSAPLPTCSDKLTCYDQFCSVFLRGGKGVWSVIMLPRFSQWSFFFFFFWHSWRSPSNLCGCVELVHCEPCPWSRSRHSRELFPSPWQRTLGLGCTSVVSWLSDPSIRMARSPSSAVLRTLTVTQVLSSHGLRAGTAQHGK